MYKRPLVDPTKPADHPVNQPKPAADKPKEFFKPKEEDLVLPQPSFKNGVEVYPPAGRNSRLGEMVLFGRYPHTDKGEVKPIRWQVLENNGGELLLASGLVLDCVKYHNTAGAAVDWATSDIRKFLNNDFLNAAFNDEEKAMLVLSRLGGNGPDNDNSVPETCDKVFLFNMAERSKYIKLLQNRYLRGTTDYACKRGVYIPRSEMSQTACNWLRNRGRKGPKSAVYISANGSGGIAKGAPDPDGEWTHNPYYGIIPLVRVKFN